MSTRFHDENIVSGITETLQISEWVSYVISSEGRDEGDLNIILTDDESLRKINRNYLSKDYYTDIISFDLSEKDEISGDLYISIERVKENAVGYGIVWMHELKRVVVHGILHLIGYNDRTEAEKLLMRETEDRYLEHFSGAKR